MPCHVTFLMEPSFNLMRTPFCGSNFYGDRNITADVTLYCALTNSERGHYLHLQLIEKYIAEGAIK